MLMSENALHTARECFVEAHAKVCEIMQIPANGLSMHEANQIAQSADTVIKILYKRIEYIDALLNARMNG